ncbi:uncharacterized protein LOC115985407 [Quercus lobata]|uniref:uncharacterized protein LOC115985407 n=1 Tax=Quercus lobata TaxID=97700 RepID=UPI001248AA18|nr:uncharacterized protein LOC115985407 [Quercus lobata]
MEHFTFIEYKVVNRGENKLADLLATLATKSVLKKEKMTLRVEKQPGNDQAEASNKRLLKILGKMTKEYGKGWKEELPTALWAHRTAKSQAIRASPFSLVYGTEVVILINLVRPAVKLAKIARIPREDTLEIVEEMPYNAASHNRLYQAYMKARHKGQVKERKFQL